MMKKCLLFVMLLTPSVYAAEHKEKISPEDWKKEMQRWMDEQLEEEPAPAQQSPRRLKVPMGFISAKQKELAELEEEHAQGYSYFGAEDAQQNQD